MRTALHELVDLFIDDWRLAGAMIVALVLAGWLAGALGSAGAWAGVFLAAAVSGALVWNLK